jgi:hypothetical protein
MKILTKKYHNCHHVQLDQSAILTRSFWLVIFTRFLTNQQYFDINSMYDFKYFNDIM